MFNSAKCVGFLPRPKRLDGSTADVQHQQTYSPYLLRRTIEQQLGRTIGGEEGRLASKRPPEIRTNSKNSTLTLFQTPFSPRLGNGRPAGKPTLIRSRPHLAAPLQTSHPSNAK